MQRKLLIASDHAGYKLKEHLKAWFSHLDWIDLGPPNDDRVDYPDYADKLCQKLVAQGGGMGVLICGSGQGMAIRANRHKGIRAALVWSDDSATLARQHNDANVICLGSRLITPEQAEKFVSLFIATSFEGGRHADRLTKLDVDC